MFQNYLLSVALTIEGEDEVVSQVATQLTVALNARYEFWELIVVVDETRANHRELVKSLSTIQNIRVIILKERTALHRARTIAASETIGDLVVISTIAEAATLDLLALADQAFTTNQVVNYRRRGSGMLSGVQAWLLSQLSGFQIASKDLKTVAFPRVLLNEILTSDLADLELRFDRLSTSRPRTRILAERGLRIRWRASALDGRLAMLTELIVYSSPRVLATLAGLAALMVVVSLAYMGYAIGVFVLSNTVAAGWLSTSLTISGLAAFIGISVCALSLGMISLFDRLRGGAQHARIEEVNNTDFFLKHSARNVDSTRKQSETGTALADR